MTFEQIFRFCILGIVAFIAILIICTFTDNDPGLSCARACAGMETYVSKCIIENNKVKEITCAKRNQ